MAHCMCISCAQICLLVFCFTILIIFLFLHSTSSVCDLSIILHLPLLNWILYFIFIFYILYFIFSLLTHVFDQFYSGLLLSYVSCFIFRILIFCRPSLLHLCQHPISFLAYIHINLIRYLRD